MPEEYRRFCLFFNFNVRSALLCSCSFACLFVFYLEHIKRTAFVALPNHYLADKVGILSHQHVLEAVDLNERHNNASVECDMILYHCLASNVMGIAT